VLVMHGGLGEVGCRCLDHRTAVLQASSAPHGPAHRVALAREVRGCCEQGARAALPTATPC
jgi:hypothetical protein